MATRAKKEESTLKKSKLPHAKHVDVIEVGSPEHEQQLIGAYNMNAEEARRIIKERDENPSTWPWDDYKRAQAFLEVFSTPNTVVATREGWKKKNLDRA